MILALMLLLSACGGSGNAGETQTPAAETTAPAAEAEAPETTEAVAEEKAYMKVVVHNIYYLDMDERADKINALHDRLDADVLLLQEVSKGWIPHLQKYMEEAGYSYYAYGRYGAEFSDAEMDDGDAFSPILWKTDKYDLVDSGHFWLSSTPEVVRSARWMDGTVSEFPRCNCWVILRDKETGREIFVTSVHFDAYNATVKLYSADLLIQKMTELRGDRPAIAGGDFNLPLSDPGYILLANSDYPDMRHQAEQTTDEGSYNAWDERSEADYGKGDHVFMSKDIDAKVYDILIEESRVDGKPISDHYPLIVEFYY